VEGLRKTKGYKDNKQSAIVSSGVIGKGTTMSESNESSELESNTGSPFILFDPATGLTEFLGPGGYTDCGLAKVALESLLPIYPSQAVGRIAALQRNISPRAERAGDDLARLSDEPCFSVVMFRRFSKNLPPGLDMDAFVDFFSNLFLIESIQDRELYKEKMRKLLVSKFYYILAITASIWVPEEETLHHYIIAATTYMFDRLSGSYIHTLGVADKGYPGKCTMSPHVFTDPSSEEPTILSETSTFTGHSLATFLLATVQVLGALHYDAPDVSLESNVYRLICNEPLLSDYSPQSHHLYLQARVQRGSAYVMYVMQGFTTLAVAGGEYHCTSYHHECPVNKSKTKVPVQDSYHTDDPLLRLLALKHWIYNTWPTDPLFRDDVASANKMWRQDNGLPFNHFLSSALIPPQTSPETEASTNVAYLKLVDASCNNRSQPLKVHAHSEEITLVQMPIDRTVTKADNDCRMISSVDFKPSDIRCSLIRSLDVHVGSCKLDAFEAIAAPLYCEGNLYPTDVDGYSHQEMSLEMRLNLQAFYRRCTHFAFTDPCIEELASLAKREYQYAVDNELLASLGFNDFDVDLGSLSDDRIGWSNNFIILGQRLTMLDQRRGLKPALWVDMQALQLLFSYQGHPVLITPVYGVSHPAKEGSDFILVVPKVGGINRLRNFPVEDDNPVFTVVPILALNVSTFGFFTHPSTVAPPTRERICEKIIEHSNTGQPHVAIYRKHPALEVVGGLNGTVSTQYETGHCASDRFCVAKHSLVKASLELNRCPGCARAVHSCCGHFNTDSSTARDGTTCFNCFNKFGRPLSGIEDPDYCPTTPPPIVPPDPESPVRNTRSLTSGTILATDVSRALFPSNKTTGRETKVQKEMKENKAMREATIDSHNPAYMYPKVAPDDEPLTWWLDAEDEELPDVELSDDFYAKKPTETQIYSQGEMLAWGQANMDLLPSEEKAKPCKDIFAAAFALQHYLLTCEEHDPSKHPFWLHRPNRPFTDQELVNISCLVDRNRPFEIDTHNSTRMDLTLRVLSYPMKPNTPLKRYFGARKLKAPKEEMLFLTVGREWLKNYLDWFDPELYQFITIHTDGLKVQRLRTMLAADSEALYEQEGKTVHDKLLVPVPKMHKPVTTQNSFGVTTDDGDFVPYSLNVSKTNPNVGQEVRHRTYDRTLTKSCNPRNFDEVPVARLATAKVPDIFLQIKAVRAEIQTVLRGGNEETTIRWLGLQGGRYVSLPSEWVNLNFDPQLLDEAQRRAQSADPADNDTHRFLIIPPGDSRDDDPPSIIRHSKGLNYYYQGQVNNCVMGGLANAVYWLCGPDQATDLLQFTTLNVTSRFWDRFIQHVHGSLKENRMRRLKRVDLLHADDTMPMVVQLKALDGSESHAICIFDDCIFDSASRFVLQKNIHALDWCCSPYGFHKTLRVYQLQSYKSSFEKPRKKRSRLLHKK
jgi:hypothetical protein